MNILVTGASRGIGLCVAESLANAGHSVTLCARNAETLKKSMASLPVINEGQKHDMWGLDMSNLATVSKMEGCPRPLSSYDGFVNCAGLANTGLLAGQSNETIEQTLNVNLYAPILMAKAVSFAMIRNTPRDQGDSKRRHLIFLSSIVASMGIPGSSIYGAAKAGIEGFVRSYAREIGSRGIAVNAIAPGVVETDMGLEAGEAALQGNIFSGFISPVEIAETVTFVLKSRALTGQTLTVDNGRTA